MRGNQAGWRKKARPDPVFTPVTCRECKRIRRPWRWYKSALGRPVQARVDMARNGGSKLGGTVLSIQRDRRLMRLVSVLVPGEPLPFQQGNTVPSGRDMCGDQASRWQEARPDLIFGQDGWWASWASPIRLPWRKRDPADGDLGARLVLGANRWCETMLPGRASAT